MAGKSGQPPKTDAPTSDRHPVSDTEATEEYEVLLRQYGEAMQRTGQLEAQVDSLTFRLKEDGPDAERAEEPAPKAQSIGMAGGTATASKEDQSLVQQRDMEIDQLRLQVVSLASQLAQSEAQVKRVEGGRLRRRSKSGHRPKWMFWRRSKHLQRPDKTPQL